MPTAELGRIDLGDVTPHNIKLLKKVNTVVFPVSYHDKFYKVSCSALACIVRHCNNSVGLINYHSTMIAHISE